MAAATAVQAPASESRSLHLCVNKGPDLSLFCRAACDQATGQCLHLFGLKVQGPTCRFLSNRLSPGSMCPLFSSLSKPGHEVGWAICAQASGQHIMLGVTAWISFLFISKAVSRLVVRGDPGPALSMSRVAYSEMHPWIAMIIRECFQSGSIASLGHILVSLMRFFSKFDAVAMKKQKLISSISAIHGLGTIPLLRSVCTYIFSPGCLK